tara:strand:- start:59 stop:184 length:126 start_codon:yes stop_codon:yes gene_type:complete
MGIMILTYKPKEKNIEKLKAFLKKQEKNKTKKNGELGKNLL